MPELPEVENIAIALRQNLQGRRLTDLRVRFPGILSQSARRTRDALLCRRLEEVYRHGKYLILNFGARKAPGTPGTLAAGASPARARRKPDDQRAHLMLHLRMTGQIFITPGYTPDKHCHLTFDFEGLPVYYRDIRKFGRFTLVEDGRRPAALSHIGPDMLEIKLGTWLRRVRDRRAPIKSALLDQGVAAGLGNIYVDEALYRAGVHPLAVPGEMSRDDLARVLRQAKAVLRLAIRHGGTTYLNFVNFHGQPGNFRRKLRVYQRNGEPCRACGASIERLVIGGRSSHFCPRCQLRGR
jgi:formamidopyrimidine-DNA glycosylase